MGLSLRNVKAIDDRILTLNNDLQRPGEAAASRYNFLYKSDTNLILAYNSLYGTIATLDEEAARFLAGKPLEKVPQNIFKRLKEFLFIIPKNLDELKLYGEFYKLMQISDIVAVMYCLTYKCNLNCTYCCQADYNKRLPLSKNADQILRNYICSLVEESPTRLLHLDWIGGEPLIRADTLIDQSRRLIEWCSSRDIEFQSQIFTNGTLITESIAESFTELNVKAWTVTIDGDRDTHNAHRLMRKTKQSCYDLVFSGLKNLVNYGHSIYVRVNFDRESAKSIPNLLDDLEREGIRESLSSIFFYNIEASSDSCRENVNPTLMTNSEYLNIFHELIELAMSRGFPTGMGAPSPRYLYCGAPLYRGVAVDCNLNLYKCATSMGNPDHVVGRIGPEGVYDRNDELENHWKGRTPWLMSPCKNCGLLPYCGAGCILMARKNKRGVPLPNCTGVNEVKLRQHILSYIKDKTGVRSLEPLLLPKCQTDRDTPFRHESLNLLP
jgi:uncharacterized protein